VEISLQQIARALNGKIRNKQVLAPGPGHSATDRSLSVALSDSGDDVVVHSFAGDDPLECKKYVREKCGIRPRTNGNGQSDHDMARLIQEAVASQHKEPRSKPVATYPYQERDGTLLYQVLRYEPKTFRQRRPDGNGSWIWKLEDRRVVYRWPELIKYPDATVHFTEGEKDADTLAALDLCSTTIASGKWTDECVEALKDRNIWIFEDADGAGRKRALEVAQCLHPVATSLKIIRLPGLTGELKRKDVTNWLVDLGHTKDELIEVCCATPDWRPDSAKDDAPPSETKATENKKANAPLIFVKIEDWIDRDPPPRDWAVPDRFPLRNVSLLSGEGSIGKSIVLMQLAGAHVLGSTAWHNSVRARAYLHPVTVEGTEPDKTLRQLEFMKSNYSAIADSITLRWKDGVFVPEAKPGSLEAIAAEAKADEAFLTLLERFTREGRNVSPNPSSPTYAVTMFTKERTGFNKLHLGEAMRRLFKAEKIRVESYGKQSRPYQRIVKC
jgi:hypothetical protein